MLYNRSIMAKIKRDGRQSANTISLEMKSRVERKIERERGVEENRSIEQWTMSIINKVFVCALYT